MKKESIIRKANQLMKQRLHLPASEVGEYSIVHEPYKVGSTLPLVSFRDHFFMGVPQCDYICKQETVIHKLVGPDGTWMSDLPCELYQMNEELAKYAKGNVLIGGLGLGIVARMVSLNPKVSSITVVERQEEVIQLTGITAPGAELIKADLFEYVKTIRHGQFNVALLDTWQSTGEWAWQTEVVPLRRSIGNKIGTVKCWHELTMVNQVADGLFRAASLPAEEIKSLSHCHWYAFRKAVEMLSPEIKSISISGDWHEAITAQEENKKNPFLLELIRFFCQGVGTSQWEKMFGQHWDIAVEASKKEEALEVA